MYKLQRPFGKRFTKKPTTPFSFPRDKRGDYKRGGKEGAAVGCAVGAKRFPTPPTPSL